MEVLEKILSKEEYLVEGGFSIADIAVSSYLLLPRFLKDIDLNRWPNVVQYMLRCASREGYGKSHSPQVKNLVIAFLGKVQEEKLLSKF
jgi:glutathione S-transferase